MSFSMIENYILKDLTGLEDLSGLTSHLLLLTYYLLLSTSLSTTTTLGFRNLRYTERPARNTRPNGMAINTRTGNVKITKRIRNSVNLWVKLIKSCTASFAAPAGFHGPTWMGCVPSS